jgi:hypothetical protein
MADDLGPTLPQPGGEPGLPEGDLMPSGEPPASSGDLVAPSGPSSGGVGGDLVAPSGPLEAPEPAPANDTGHNWNMPSGDLPSR